MKKNFYGIDFSGAKNAGSLIYVSKGSTDGTQLHVHDTKSLKELTGVTSRKAALDELREFIKNRPNAIHGLDFPFALPEDVVDETTWTGFIEKFSREFDDITPKEFTEYWTSKASGRHRKREREIRFVGQCPYGLQIRVQTLFGIRNVIAPLILNENASVLPMQPKQQDVPWIIEVYPAGTLGSLGLYRTQYKDETKTHRKRRLFNLDELSKLELRFESSEIKATAIDNDNALDSIISLFTTYRAYTSGEIEEAHHEKVEGHLYI